MSSAMGRLPPQVRTRNGCWGDERGDCLTGPDTAWELKKGGKLVAPDAVCSCLGSQPNPATMVPCVLSRRKGAVYVDWKDWFTELGNTLGSEPPSWDMLSVSIVVPSPLSVTVHLHTEWGAATALQHQGHPLTSVTLLQGYPEMKQKEFFPAQWDAQQWPVLHSNDRVQGWEESRGQGLFTRPKC